MSTARSQPAHRAFVRSAMLALLPCISIDRNFSNISTAREILLAPHTQYLQQLTEKIALSTFIFDRFVMRCFFQIVRSATLSLPLAIACSISHAQDLASQFVPGNSKQLDFAIYNSGKPMALAKLKIGKYIKLEGQASDEVSVSGPLSLYLVTPGGLFSKTTFQLISPGSAIKLTEDNSTKESIVSVASIDNRSLESSSRSIFAACEQGNPSVNTCYRLNGSTLAFNEDSFYKTDRSICFYEKMRTDEVSSPSAVSNNTKHIVYRLTTSGDCLAGRVQAVLLNDAMKADIEIKAKGNYASMKQAEEEKRRAAEAQQAIANAARQKEHEALNQLVQKLPKYPVGTYLYCSNIKGAGGFLANEHDMITDVLFKCDLTGEALLNIRDITSAKFDIVNQVRMQVQGVAGMSGYKIDLIFKKAS